VNLIVSHASGKSGSRDFEEPMVEMSYAQPPSTQNRLRSEPIALLQSYEPFLANPVGAFSAPNRCTLTGKENLGSKFPTALRRADVAI